MTYRDRVIEEDRRQKALLAAGKPIPPELKKYARQGGLAMLLLGTAGAIFVWKIGLLGDRIFIGALLFMLFIAVAGIAQIVTGRYRLRK